jgi:hypothetical protein
MPEGSSQSEGVAVPLAGERSDSGGLKTGDDSFEFIEYLPRLCHP